MSPSEASDAFVASGIVWLRMAWGVGEQGGDQLTVWETSKVYDGQIHAVEAFMRNLPVELRNGGWDRPRQMLQQPSPRDVIAPGWPGVGLFADRTRREPSKTRWPASMHAQPPDDVADALLTRRIERIMPAERDVHL